MAGEAETGLATRLREAKDAVARLEALAGAATCADMGEHDWQLIGGRWCGCSDGSCSVPVYECARCKDCDYGDSAEAEEIRLECARAFETEEEAIRRHRALTHHPGRARGTGRRRMKRSDLTYRAVQGLAGCAGPGLLIVGGWAVLDAVTWHFGRPVAYLVAACAMVISLAAWLDELVPPEQGGGAPGGAGEGVGDAG